MKNLRLVAISLVAMFVAVLGVRAAEVEYPDVVDATFTDSLAGTETKPTVAGTKTSEVTVTVKEGAWNLLGKEDEPTRPVGYTWVGLKFTWVGTVSDVKFDGENDARTLTDGKTFTEYFGFNLEDVKAAAAKGENVTKTFTLNWKNDGEEGTLTINLVVEPAKITMVDKYTEAASSDPVWNEEIYNETVEEAHTHDVIVDAEGEGTIGAPETAVAGEKVTVTIEPEEGYEIADMQVLDANGEEVKYTVTDDGLEFTMPEGNVTISVKFTEVVLEPEKADTTELEKVIAEAEKYLDDKKYDAKEVEALRKIIEEAKGLIGADKEGQETVDAMVEVLKDAMTKVANTGDNIMSVVATGIASLAVIAGGIVLVRKNKFNN